MADDDGLEQLLINHSAEIRRHFDVTAEGMNHRFDLVAESIHALDEKLDRAANRLDEKIERTAASQSMILLARGIGPAGAKP